MAHEITGTDNMVYVNEVPWHGLGTQFKAGQSLTDWANEAFGWTAQSCPVSYEWGGTSHTAPDHRILVRSDNGTRLGLVSADYKPVQPEQVVSFFRDLCDQLGLFTMETLGSLRGGKRIWGLAKAKKGVKLGKGDTVNRYALLATSFDLTLATILQQTSIRVVCNNTLSAAVRAGQEGEEDVLRFTHLQVFDNKVVQQKAAMESGWEVFATALDKLASKQVTEAQARGVFMDTYYPPAFRETSKRFFEKGAERHVNRLMEIFAEAPGQQLASAKNTAWGVVNAVTYQVDHEARAATSDARLNNAWFGKGEEQKARAFDLALQLAN